MTEIVQGRTITLTATFERGDGTRVDVDALTITILPVAGGAAVVGPTSTGITNPATGVYGYSWATAADLTATAYLALWEGTYDGDDTSASEVVTVLSAPVAGAYASVDDLTEHLTAAGLDVPANAALLLVRASRDVDRALLCAVYDDEDQDVIAALNLATLEQVASGLTQGDTSGSGTREAGAFTIGRINVQRWQGSQTGAATKVGPLWSQAWQLLQAAGLTGRGPQEPWHGLG